METKEEKKSGTSHRRKSHQKGNPSTVTVTSPVTRHRTLKDRLFVPETIYNRINWIVCSLGVVGILLWLLFPTTPESQIIPHTFSPGVTLWFQERLGTDGFMAWFASLYYNFPMMTNIVLLFVVIYFAPKGKKGRESWIYGVSILLGFWVEMIIYFAFPVAPPIRVPEYLNQGIVQVRLNKLPWSDKLITLKYNALPSGHMIYSILGYLVCREEGFTIPGYFYLTNTLVFSFIILYLGEHYWIDIIGSFIVAISVFFLTTQYFDAKYPKSIKKLDSKTKNFNKK